MVSFRFVSSFQTFVVCPIVATGGACHRRFCTPIDSPRSWSGGWIRKNSRPMPNPRDAPTLAGATSGHSSSPVSRLGSGRVDSPGRRHPLGISATDQCKGSGQCSHGHRGRCSGLTPPPTCCPVRVSGLGSHGPFSLGHRSLTGPTLQVRRPLQASFPKKPL